MATSGKARFLGNSQQPQLLSTSPAPARSLHGAIARDIGIKIVSGHHKRDEVLASEITASSEMRVSRTAYREAMRMLIAKGLLAQRPKSGTRVTAQEEWHLLDPDVLAWIFEAEPDEQLFTQLFDLRKVIEPEAAARAAKYRNKRELAQMTAALENMARYGLAFDEGRRADQEFHHIILRASRNMFLASLSNGISAAINWTTIFRLRTHSHIRNGVDEHRKVYEAIAAADPVAAHESMSKLIELALLDIKNSKRKHKRKKS
ncbi:MAG TPA: FCD domain-containing protein [Steroidobacteraceae bacterium]|nr:FCD domain-containing protein [Steroidobacteraceae bacterium]